MKKNNKYLPLNKEVMKSITGGKEVRKLVETINIEVDCPDKFLEMNPNVKCIITNQTWDVYNVNIFGKQTYSHSETTCD